MKNLIATALALLFLAFGAVASERCAQFLPDSTALRSRMDAQLLAGQMIDSSRKSIRLAKVAETQLSVIDVLVGFDYSAVQWLADNKPGQTPESYAMDCISRMNDCLRKSDVSEFSFRLAGIVNIQEDLSAYVVAPYYLHNVIGRFVNAMGDVVAAGACRELTNKRAEVGADIVSIIVDGPGGSSLQMAGAGYSLEDDRDAYGNLAPDQYRYSLHPDLIPSFGDWAYNCCLIRQVDDSSALTMLHEIGHNMGCGHADRVNSSAIEAGPQLYPFSSAAYFTGVDNDVDYYTIMGYNFDGFGNHYESAPVFSSPRLTYAGTVVGDEHHDNRKTLLTTYQYVAQYRVSKLAPAPEPDPEPTPEPQPSPVDPEADVDDHAVFTAKTVINGAMWEGDSVVGLVQFTVAKTDKRNYSKVSAVVTGLNGKKLSGKATKCPVRGTATTAKVDVEISVKGYPEPLCAVVTSDGALLDATLGGAVIKTTKMEPLASASPKFQLQNFPSEIDGQLVLTDLLPTEVGFGVVNTKWTFAKPSSVKMKKNRATNEIELIVDTGKDGEKSNLSGLKLTYASKTGLFKGTFTVYAITSAQKLKKYKVSVSGVVVDGEGSGIAVLKRPVVEIPVAIR